MDSKNNIVDMSQGGLSLGQKEYYLSEEESFSKIREAFKVHIVKMFKLVGDNDKTANRKMESVMAIETRIAKASKSRTELRDPASNYHKMSYADFKRDFAGYDWDFLFQTNFVDGLQTLTVGQPEAIKEAVAVLNETDLRQIKDWMQWTLLNGNSSALGDEVYLQNFDFYSRTMSGAKEPRPRWKRSVDAVSGVLGEAVGQMYVEKYFPAENKARMENLVKNLQVALAERIDAQDWMSAATKAAAKEKLASFIVKVGYPDKWTDMSALHIDNSKSYAENVMLCKRYWNAENVKRRAGKSVDPTRWGVNPQTVNAYYDPTTNEICFPAGILQPPFFDMEADDVVNYGTIGTIIGHEMTHGFDDEGRLYDKDGNLRDWWAPEDAAKFREKADMYADFFDAIEVLPGLHANGRMTLGENLADHGGLQVSWTAYKNATQAQPLPAIDGFTADQRFFLSYANVWAQNITDAALRFLTTNDVHSLGRWRVNGALPHIDAWYEAFGIKEGDKLIIPKEQRLQLW